MTRRRARAAASLDEIRLLTTELATENLDAKVSDRSVPVSSLLASLA